MVQVYVKRTYKDTLFRMIFREKKELLTLYNALNGSDFSDPDELEIRTVDTCIKERILDDFLRKHRAEVKDVILSEYDEKLHIDNEKSQSFKEGKTTGLIEGKAAGIIEGKNSGLIAGRAESLLDILEEKGEITAELRNRILATTDPELLRQWVKGALKAESVEAFIKQFGLL